MTENENETKTIVIEDILATWGAALPALLAIYECGDRSYAVTELRRMAAAADEAVAGRKGGEVVEDAVHVAQRDIYYYRPDYPAADRSSVVWVRPEGEDE